MNRVLLIKAAGLHPLSLVGRLAGNFFQEDFILARGNSNTNVLINRMKVLSRGSTGIEVPVYAIYAGGDCVFIQTMKEKSPLLASLESDLSPEQRDYEILTQDILQSVLGLNPEQLSASLVQSTDLATALVEVEEDKYQYLFLLNN